MSQCQIGEGAAGGRTGSKKGRRDTVDRVTVKRFGNRFKGSSRCSTARKRIIFVIGILVECAVVRYVEKVKRKVFPERGFVVGVARLPWPTNGHQFLRKPRERVANTSVSPLHSQSKSVCFGSTSNKRYP